MLAALIALGFLLTGCGLLNPVKDTVWVMTETYTDDAGSYYGYDLTTTYTNKYTLSFAKDTLSMKVDGTVTSLGVSVSDSYTLTGTYEYKSGEVIGTMSYGGVSSSFTATVEKDTLTIKGIGGSTESRTFTKQE